MADGRKGDRFRHPHGGLRADRHGLEDSLEVLVPDADAAVSDVPAEQARVERAVDEVALAKTQGVVPERPRFDPVLQPLRDGLPFLDEGPIRLDPIRVGDLRFDAELASRRVKNPFPLLPPGFLEDDPAAAGDNGRANDLLAVLDIEPVRRRVDDDIQAFR